MKIVTIVITGLVLYTVFTLLDRCRICLSCCMAYILSMPGSRPNAFPERVIFAHKHKMENPELKGTGSLQRLLNRNYKSLWILWAVVASFMTLCLQNRNCLMLQQAITNIHESWKLPLSLASFPTSDSELELCTAAAAPPTFCWRRRSLLIGAQPPTPPTACRRRAGAVFVTCSRNVVHQLYVAWFL